ncbi:hypothetical protein [Tenacibaculum piscium]|uniref:hypothetical protein n=1 Tax=Tenacibaculum piscium TaxID=1458515 RepID=UPI001F2BDC17|nr:hypothetical protein [Tenacibaculum piscium]
MNTIQLIKKHLPNIKPRDRQTYVNKIEEVSRVTKTSIIEVIKGLENELNNKVSEMRERSAEPMMAKILITGLLIEANDQLEGTLFHNYYCRITSGIGKRFMNAQTLMYNTEYNNLLSTRLNDVSYLNENVERGVKVLSKVIKTDSNDMFEIIEAMQGDEILRKRIAGIYKQHLKSVRN